MLFVLEIIAPSSDNILPLKKLFDLLQSNPITLVRISLNDKPLLFSAASLTTLATIINPTPDEITPFDLIIDLSSLVSALRKSEIILLFFKLSKKHLFLMLDHLDIQDFFLIQ